MPITGKVFHNLFLIISSESTVRPTEKWTYVNLNSCKPVQPEFALTTKLIEVREELEKVLWE